MKAILAASTATLPVFIRDVLGAGATLGLPAHLAPTLGQTLLPALQHSIHAVENLVALPSLYTAPLVHALPATDQAALPVGSIPALWDALRQVGGTVAPHDEPGGPDWGSLCSLPPTVLGAGVGAWTGAAELSTLCVNRGAAASAELADSDALVRSVQAAWAEGGDESSLQHGKAGKVLAVLRWWEGVVGSLPPPLVPSPGGGAQAAPGLAKNMVPADTLPLEELGVHSHTGLYKPSDAALCCLAPTCRTYATVLAACLDGGLEEDAKQCVHHLLRAMPPAVRHMGWGVACAHLPGGADASLLPFALQPGMLRRLVGCGLLSKAAVDAVLSPPPGSAQAALLLAAEAAGLGNQPGSKHGCVLLADIGGALLVSGHNHSFPGPAKGTDIPFAECFYPAPIRGSAARQDDTHPPHAKRPRTGEQEATVWRRGTPRPPSAQEALGVPLSTKQRKSRRAKVMHAEVHCLSRLALPAVEAETAAYTLGGGAQSGASSDAAPSRGVLLPAPDSTISTAEGTTAWVVELDGLGVGYEEAVPCPSCTLALCRQGVRRAMYTSHVGVSCLDIRDLPGQAAETLAFAVHSRVLNWVVALQERAGAAGAAASDGPPDNPS